MFEKAIRQAVARRVVDLAKLGADSREIHKGAEAVRKSIPLPARWFVKIGHIESALGAAAQAAQTLAAAARSSGRPPAAEAAINATDNHTSRGNPEFESARARLAARGIRLERRSGGYAVMIQLQKRGWTEARAYEIGRVSQDGDTYEVLMLALPYFLGPNWRVESEGGQPQLLTCDTVQELVELLEFRPGEFIDGGILHTQE